ncbi:hypothetical protein Celaphus_00002605, partial [Cervus elaphus hippelaphus]
MTNHNYCQYLLKEKSPWESVRALRSRGIHVPKQAPATPPRQTPSSPHWRGPEEPEDEVPKVAPAE